MNENFQEYKHYNKQMERAILGACLIEKSAITRLYGLVEPEHFYEDANKFICERLFEMWRSGVPIDTLMVAQTINHTEWAKISPDPIAWYLTVLINNVASSAHLEAHSLILRQLFANRATLMIKMGIDVNQDGLEALMTLKSQIEGVFKFNTSDDWVGIDEVLISGLVAHMDEVKGKDVLGVRSGFPTLDKISSGFQAGQLIVIGARPSVGKSAFAGKIANEAAKQGNAVGIITLEMPNEQLGARLVSLESDIEFWRIWRNKLNEDQYAKVMRDMGNMAQLKISFSDHSGVSMSGIRAKAEKLKARNGLDMLIIDYLQLVDPDNSKGSNREREVAKMSLGFKRMAMELEIPVILLAQLNRGSETGGGDKKPRLHNLRESGAIEQDADIVIMLHRDKLEEQDLKSKGSFGPYDASLIVEKNRNGACGEIPIKFDDAKMKFFEDSFSFAPLSNHQENNDDGTEDIPF
jgi:replicative DNA helicase